MLAFKNAASFLMGLLALSHSYAMGADFPRLRMLEELSSTVEASDVPAKNDQQLIRDCVRSAANAANEEDLTAYLACFSTPLQRSARRRVGMLFASHDVSVELVDSHILDESSDSAEVAVKYVLTLSSLSGEFVSLIRLKKEESGWRISKETVQSVGATDSRSDSMSVSSNASTTSACFGGTCPPKPRCSSGRCGGGSDFDVKGYLNGN